MIEDAETYMQKSRQEGLLRTMDRFSEQLTFSVLAMKS